MSRKLLKLLRRGGETWISKNALLYDKFSTPDAAPLTSPRTCEPGPGTLKIVDTTNTASIVNGIFRVASGAGYGNPGAWSNAATNILTGYGWYVSLTPDINNAFVAEFGIDDNQAGSPQAPRFRFGSSGSILLISTDVGFTGLPLRTYLADTEYKALIVARSSTAGFYMIVDGELLWAEGGDLAKTAHYPYFGSGVSGDIDFNEAALLPLATYNPAWGGDWTEVTDTDATPAATESVDRDAGSALIELGDITLPSDAMAVQIRRVDAANYTTLDIAADGSATIKETIAGSEGAALVSIGAGGISDASSLKVLDNAGAVKVFSAGVLAGSAALTDHSEAVLVYIEALGTGGALSAVTTHPYPALGIATSRAVAPQTTNTYTHAANFVAEIKNVTLPAANDLSFQFRISGSDELTLNLASDGSLALLDNATSRITAAGGTVSSTDDIVFVCDGANGQIFVDGVSAGTTTAIAHLTGTAGKRLDATTGVCDHIALFPRDVSGLLPKGTF